MWYVCSQSIRIARATAGLATRTRVASESSHGPLRLINNSIFIPTQSVLFVGCIEKPRRLQRASDSANIVMVAFPYLQLYTIDHDIFQEIEIQL
jgi:hypothetical protein